MSKKSILVVSSVYVVCFVAGFLASLLCESSKCRIYDDSVLGWILLNFIFLIPVFLFSLITYKMRDEVFQAWWKFARWFVPVIMLVTLLINSQSRGGGMGISGAISSSFNLFIIGIFYAIFVITSLVKITLAYRRVK
jgi:hypothetical protein